MICLKGVELEMGRAAVKYEATVYNRDVRDALKSGQDHPQYYAGWAYQNVVTVDVESLDAARSEIARRYPESDGFVVMSIDPCHPYGWHRDMTA